MRKLAFAFAGLLVLGSTAGAREPELGKPAPDFTVTDTKGAQVRLSDFKGKLVVLEWSNHQCPYVRKHYGSNNMQKVQAAARDLGVVWLTIVSSSPGNQGYVEAAQADKLTEERGAKPSHVVLDPTGKLGLLYGARVTPHMYIVGKEGELLYKGGIDSIRSSRASDIAKAKNYVTAALGEIKDGKAVTDADTTAYGCTIHYKEGS